MTIVIPMAGLSSRFTKAGYVLPKYMLYAVDRSLFNIAVSSFEKYFVTCRFVFVARDVFDTRTFIERECEQLAIKDFQVVMLSEPTRGQAETVLKGVEGAQIPDDEPILIFNIDTFRPGYQFPEIVQSCDGYLEVFKGSGANWSYARTAGGDDSRVVETAEKKEISDNCSTGIYYFAKTSLFRKAYNAGNGNSELKELYVAPLYNNLIKEACDIRIHVISREEVIFCGVPQEYLDYLRHALM